MFFRISDLESELKSHKEKLANQESSSDNQRKANALEISKIKNIIRSLIGFKISFEENESFKLIYGKKPENFLKFKVS